MKTIEINGKEFTIEELNDLVEKAKKNNPMEEVYKYHNTTEEEFDKLYKGLPKHVKGYAKECMVIEWYNKGVEPDFNDGSLKYYPYFDMRRGKLVYYDWRYHYSYSNVGARQLYLGKNAKKNMLEAVEKFIDVYKESRQW